MCRFFTLYGFVFVSFSLFSQLGIGTNEPDASSALHIKAKDLGLLIPRMTTGQRDNIALPAEGLQIYNTEDRTFQINIGSNNSPVWASFLLSTVARRTPRKVHEGDIILTTQAEVVDFGGQRYTEINGSLEIIGEDITNLFSLKDLTSIKGNLDLSNNSALTSLKGLDNLESVGGNMRIINNTSLTSLDGLDNLRVVEKEVLISGNSALTSLSGLNNLIVVRDLFITKNNSLTSLKGLDNLKVIVKALTVENNKFLTSLNGLNAITRLDGNLTIKMGVLNSLNGLDNLKSVDGNVLISETALPSLDGLNNLERVDGDLYIRENPSLTSLNDLGSLLNVMGDFNILLNGKLVDVCAVKDVNVIGNTTFYMNGTPQRDCSISP